MNNLIQLTDKQKTNIFESIKKYIENIDNPDVKFKTKQKIQDNNFKNLMIGAFISINFLSQTCVLSLKKLFDDNLVFMKILEDSKNDEFEVKELKMYLINNLLNENLPPEYIDKSFNSMQLKEYRKKMAYFKREYMNIFEDKSSK